MGRPRGRTITVEKGSPILMVYVQTAIHVRFSRAGFFITHTGLQRKTGQTEGLCKFLIVKSKTRGYI
jgi:hypothetical protein